MASRPISGSRKGSRLDAGALCVSAGMFAIALLAELAGPTIAVTTGLALFVLGLGHGAGDENEGVLRAYTLPLVVAYVVTALAIAALYVAWPLLGLSIFLALSAWHFARSDSGMARLPGVAIAALAVGGSVVLRPDTTAQVFGLVLGQEAPPSLMLVLALAGVAGLGLTGLGVALRRRGAAAAVLAAAACLVFHPVLAVGVIFLGMHALPVQRRQIARYGLAPVLRAITAPTLVATIAAGLMALAVWHGQLALELAIALAFGMATPHMLTERLER